MGALVVSLENEGGTIVSERSAQTRDERCESLTALFNLFLAGSETQTAAGRRGRSEVGAGNDGDAGLLEQGRAEVDRIVDDHALGRGASEAA